MPVPEYPEITINRKKNHIHLLSGGLDSAYKLLEEMIKKQENQEKAVIYPIFINYGQYAATAEWNSVKDIVKYIQKFSEKPELISNPIKISLASDLFKWCKSDAIRGKDGINHPEIENRNMVLFSVLASYLIACAKNQGINETDFEITSGFQKDEMYDSTELFFKKISTLVELYTNNRKRKLTFNFKIWNKKKRDTIKGNIKKMLGGSESELNKFLKMTTSCYSATKISEECGQCSKCKLL